MVCPWCGAPTRVTMTRAVGDQVARTRKCKGCAVTFATLETVTDRGYDIINELDRLRRNNHGMENNKDNTHR